MRAITHGSGGPVRFPDQRHAWVRGRASRRHAAGDVRGSREGRRRRPRPPRTSFIGREAEIASLLELLRSPDVGLVTITGRSGAGKSGSPLRSRDVRRDLPGGAVRVDCRRSTTRPPAGGGRRCAGPPGDPGQRPEDALRRSLQGEPTLILADDLDHVPGAVEVLLDILDDCPGSHVLATAASPLRARGEHVVRLGTLSLPTSRSRPGDGPARPGGRALLDRASAVDAGFRCTAENAGSVAGLVQRLDGLPLAIELAAARVTTLAPAAQLEMLAYSHPLDLAPIGAADRTGRRTELRAAIAWSHRLLGERNRPCSAGWPSSRADAPSRLIRAISAGPSGDPRPSGRPSRPLWTCTSWSRSPGRRGALQAPADRRRLRA